MDNDVFVALIASLSALSGSIIGIAGSLILARLQSRHQDFRELRDTRLKAHQDLARGLAELLSEIRPAIRNQERKKISQVYFHSIPRFQLLLAEKAGVADEDYLSALEAVSALCHLYRFSLNNKGRLSQPDAVFFDNRVTHAGILAAEIGRKKVSPRFFDKRLSRISYPIVELIKEVEELREEIKNRMENHRDAKPH